MHHFENISPLSCLNLPISEFLSLSKSVKSNRIIYFFKNLGVSTSIYHIYIQWELNKCPTIHATVLTVWIILVWLDCNHIKHKTTWLHLGFCGRVSYIRFFFIFMTKNRIFKGQNILVIYINILAPEIEELDQTILYRDLHWGFHVKKRTHMDPTFVAQSPPPIEMACTVDL